MYKGPYHDDDTAVEVWTHAHMLDDGSEFIVVGLKLIGPALEERDLAIGEALRMAHAVLTNRAAKAITI